MGMLVTSTVDMLIRLTVGMEFYCIIYIEGTLKREFFSKNKRCDHLNMSKFQRENLNSKSETCNFET